MQAIMTVRKSSISHPDVPAPFRTNRIVDGLNMGGGFIDGSYGPMKKLWGTNFQWRKAMVGLWWVSGSGKELKYNNDNDRDLTPDELNAQWAEKRLMELAEEEQDAPFFHVSWVSSSAHPLIAPQKYFDMYPLDSIQLADILPGDKEDTFLHLVDQFETKKQKNPIGGNV